VDAFAFFAKLLGTSARVGAAIALVAVAVYLGRRAGVNFFVDLNETLFQTLVIAGLIGAAMVAVELVLAFGRFLKWISSRISNYMRKRAERKSVKNNALKEHAKSDARIRSGTTVCSNERPAAVYSEQRQQPVIPNGTSQSSRARRSKLVRIRPDHLLCGAALRLERDQCRFKRISRST
jgi:hypothetical protein